MREQHICGALVHATGLRWGEASNMSAESTYPEGENMAVRLLLVLAIFVTLYGCGQQSAQHQHPEKKEKVGNSAKVELQPANGSGTRGTATFSKAAGGVKVVLKVTGLPKSGTMYLARIHPGNCAEEAEGEEEMDGGEHSNSHHHEHGATEEIEYPLTPVKPDAQGDGTSATVVHGLTLEGLFSGDPQHVNVHRGGSGEPPPVTCANLDEANSKKQGRPEGTRQPESTAPEPSARTHASGGASGNTSGEEQAAHSQPDCRLVFYVANKNMSPKEANAFSKLLADMIRTMEGPSWTEGELRNAALDHLAVPRYRECKHIQ